MPVPRADKSVREATVRFRGRDYPVRYVELTSAEEEELRDQASAVGPGGFEFRPFRYFGLSLRRMVQEVDGEPLTESSPAWLEMDGGFKDALRKAVFREDEAFFRGGEEGAAG